MPEEKILLPPVPEHPLLDVPSEEKLRQEIERLRAQLEEERNRNRSKHGENKGPKRPPARTLWIIGIALVAVLLIAFFVGFLPHYRREKQLQKDAEAEARALPVLSYIYAERSPPGTVLVLPGSVEAFTDAPVLARADGYLKKRFVDIGDRVKAGQLLAQISAPDLDQQVEQARAQLLQGRASLRQSRASLDQARANQALSNVTANRWAALLKRGAVAPQDNDARQADFRAQTANVAALEEAVGAAEENLRATQANLNRLLELQNYEQVRAPFTGVVTLRNIDEGALITTGQTLLFRVAKTDRLRTYVNVPESNAPLVQVGNSALLSVAEYPGRQFHGDITRTSSSLDPTTRTLLTEVQIPNNGGTLLPGMFSEVTLKQSRPNPPVLVPADALIVRPNGTFVAVLKGDAPRETEGRTTKESDAKGKGKKKAKDVEKEKAERLQEQQQLPTFTVHLEPVTVGRDYGNAVEILTGLNGGERVIENPNDRVQENAQVKGEKSKDNPVTTNQSQPGKQNSNSENLSPHPNAEPAPKQPSKERMNRGPGF